MKNIFWLLGWAVIILAAGCTAPEKPAAARFNEPASLSISSAFPARIMEDRVIATSYNRKQHTMSALYGNDIAVAYARSHAEGLYPAGAVLSLVTWQQREDEHWFGARIPDAVRSVEMLTFRDTAALPVYRVYSGNAPIPAAMPDAVEQQSRIAYISGIKAAVFPY